MVEKSERLLEGDAFMMVGKTRGGDLLGCKVSVSKYVLSIDCKQKFLQDTVNSSHFNLI